MPLNLPHDIQRLPPHIHPGHVLLRHAANLPHPLEQTSSWHGMYHLMPGVWIATAVFLSAILASFYGVLVYRLPAIFGVTFTEYARTRKDTTIMDRSHCDSCDRILNIVDLIPVIGWLIRRGKCPDCGSPIPAVYPIIEGIAGIVGGILLYLSDGNFIPVFIASWLFLIAWMDDKTQWLPDGLWIPVMFTALLLPLFGWSPVSLSSAIGGFALGWALLFVVFGAISLLRQEDLMNYADIWLFASLLGLVGYEAAPLFVGGTALLTIPYIAFMKFRARVTGSELEYVNGQADSVSASELDENDMEEWSLGIPMAPLMCLCATILMSIEFIRNIPFSLPG